ncbi:MULTISPECIES: ABC transporter substrate-binding protein [unclassified Halomonas]|uniref:ABC transporter substrate-binding protein n=1 Tax=unclassified Halomonas TaxID=2609666 RepID=UPI0028863879|nr:MULTISPECIES: ABC transporter substrate-binding protein [unclassified Halomonas]MDT0501038.1 ABC transporter substrate-binding protein [Halomonas sp. PAR7]MDT0513229.1 ABC transporter substrate-binding protein [Halomonas sp. LES1]MDT0592259.1 ABC transporter substrate-binding protein [Halomonas sp. PAR8]
MKQLARLGLGLLLSTGLATAHAEEVKIGMITTLSGGGSHLGVDVRDAFLLAIEQSGRDDIEVLVQDDARKPDLARNLANEFMQRDEVDLMTGIIWSNLAMAVVPSVVRQGTFYLSPNAGPSALAGRMCHANYFNVAYQNDNLHGAMGAWMKEQGYERPLIMAPNYPAGTDALAGFKHLYEGEVADELYTQMGQTDYAAEIAQIRASDADSLFFFLPGGMGISFMKQWQNAGVELPVFGAAFSFDETLIKAVGEAAIGARNTSLWAYDLDNDTSRAFVESFQQAYDRMPTLYAAQGFDTANLILSALGKAHPDDQDAFREALREADFDSVRGELRFGPNQHPIQDIYVREVVAGEDGEPTNRLLGIAVEDIQDIYYPDCKM